MEAEDMLLLAVRVWLARPREQFGEGFLDDEMEGVRSRRRTLIRRDSKYRWKFRPTDAPMIVSGSMPSSEGILAAHQPAYLPWLGYLDKLARTSYFVIRDDVPLFQGSSSHGGAENFVNRNRIRTAQGWQWLTVPIDHSTGPRLADLRMDESRPWRAKHLRVIESAYKKSPYFRTVFSTIATIVECSQSNFCSYCIEGTTALAKTIGIKLPRLLLASDVLLPDRTRDKNQDLIALCHALGCKTYLSGAQGRQYLDEHQWTTAGIRINYQDFRYPVYQQPHTGPFMSNLSAIDALFNMGPDQVRTLLGAA